MFPLLCDNIPDISSFYLRILFLYTALNTVKKTQLAEISNQATYGRIKLEQGERGKVRNLSIIIQRRTKLFSLWNTIIFDRLYSTAMLLDISITCDVKMLLDWKKYLLYHTCCRYQSERRLFKSQLGVFFTLRETVVLWFLAMVTKLRLARNFPAYSTWAEVSPS